MKSAKAMFRKLKYKQRFDTINFISYEKELKNKLIVIHFDNKKKKVSKFKAGLSIYYQDREDVEISLKELQAINKQVEELHWNDITVNIDVKLDGKKVMEAMRGGNNA